MIKTAFKNFLKQSRRLTDMDEARLLEIHKAVVDVLKQKIPGDLAELGVNKGGSALMIANTLRFYGSNKKLFLFDSFQGMPDPHPKDAGVFKKGDYSRTSLEVVHKNLAGSYDNIELVPGFVEDTIPLQPEGRQFSFVHIDLDLYVGTKIAIEYFYPCMSPGGIILDDDAVVLDGARKAFRDYFKDNASVMRRLPTKQVVIVKSTT